MTIDTWPSEISHGVQAFDLVGGESSGGAFGEMPAATAVSPSGPHWVARVDRLPIHTPVQVSAVRGLQSRLAGGARPVMIPCCETFDPGGSPVLDAAASAGATTIIITGNTLPLVGGEPFSATHAASGVGKRLYRIAEALGGSPAEYRIEPPLRAALADSAALDFATPACAMHLVDGFGLPLDMGRFSQVEAVFEEWFDPGPLLRTLRLTPNSIYEASPEDTLVGYIIGATSGSTLTLIDDAGGRFKLVAVGDGWTIVAGATATDYDVATSHNITVRETLVSLANSPNDSVLTINVLTPGPAALAVVQEGGVSETFHFTLDANPTDGNHLFACAYDDAGAPTVAAGWTSLGAQSASGAAPGMRIAVKGPVSGELPAQIPFSGSPSGNRGGVMIFEVAGIVDIGAAVQAIAFAAAPATGDATAVVTANTTESDTLALAFSGWENSVNVSFSMVLATGWVGPHVSGPNMDNKAAVMGSKSVAGIGVPVTATTTTGVAAYGLTGGLLLLGTGV